VFFSSVTYAQEPETIREMQENIKQLEKEKTNLEYKWDSFQLWNFTLWDLIDTNLTSKQKSTLETLVIEYSNNLNPESTTEDYQKSELYFKRDFYKSLLPFIAKQRQQDFKTYIVSDVELSQKTKTVNVEIQEIQETKNERVVEIQEKIEDNNKKLRQNIQQKVISSISEKLESFSSTEKFQSLSPAAKTKIFSTVQGRLKAEINRLEALPDTTSIVEEKVNIYKVIISQLQSYIDSWNK